MKSKNFFITFSVSLIVSLGVPFGQTASAEKKNPDNKQRSSQYLAYPVPDYGIPELSSSPEGYVPFHMEHYGRHGSRWRISKKDYSAPVEMLQKAYEDGKLTPEGVELFEQVKIIAEDSKDRLGELTPLGHRQHRGIARRMAANFPEIFNDSTYLDAKSTVIIRCILSMANEVAEFEKMFPGIKTKMDASRTTQNILAYNSLDTVAKRLGDSAFVYVEEFAATLPKPDAFFNRIFNDRQYVIDSLNEDKVFDRIFDLAVNIQSHDAYPSLFGYFTEEELQNQWLFKNADWYVTAGNTPLTNNRVPFNQRVLLRNIIESADTAMMSLNTSVNLRFGHESIVLPLTVLMELNDAAYETTDLSTLADHWRNYEIFPMGSNIQIVFYRPSKGLITEKDILVKVLLNEAETTLPVTPVTGNYYRWTDLRDYYLEKLDSFYTRFPE
ncbi:MAG: histidine acid phosphatase [Muribaculaceae bacterium]|nr:histidine acid phosphatase [Muribaculaceae bacterium]